MSHPSLAALMIRLARAIVRDTGSKRSGGRSPDTSFASTTLGKAVSENLTISVTALNLMTRRFLLDNSQTFGGTHYADPRQVYLEVKYRFHY